MFKRVLIMLLSLLAVLPVMAQDNSMPQAAIDAALTAVENQFGDRATNFTFQLLGDTNDSSLGCPLVQGEELPFNVSAVRVDVIYPNGATYTVFTSISGQNTILCDSKFEADILAGQLTDETLCNATPTQTLPAYEAPNTSVEGVFAAEATPYRVYGASSDGGWYQIASADIGLGWIDAASVVLSGDCTGVPTTSIADPTLQPVCFVEPQGGFTNVRATPEGELVGRIYETEVYQVSARNTAATWFYIDPAGWVSNTVIFPLGDCNNVTVNDNAIGVGFETAEGVVNTDVATILERFTCPADFAGYLVPRIGTGEGTAQVSAGTIPNTLRAFPSVDDAEAPRLGVIQPLRVIDRVLAGPACNQGFVWWLVEIDGVTGWTAESNQSSNDYFLESTGEGNTPSTEPSFEPISVSDNPVTEVIYSADGSRLFIQTTVQGFGDGQIGAVIVVDATTGEAIAQIEEPSGIADIDLTEDTNTLLVAAINGTLTLYDTQTLDQLAQLTDQYGIFTESPQIEVAADGSFAVIVTCLTNEACTGSSVTTINMTDGDTLASATLDAPAIDMTISENGFTLGVMTANGITFHDAQTLELISEWANTDGFTLSNLAINATGESALFTGCNNADCTQGRIGLITVADGSLRGVVASHDTEATAITYNEDFTRFVTVADQSGEVIERNATTGDETQRFAFNESNILTLMYSPDGRAIAAGTLDGRVIFLTPAI